MISGVSDGGYQRSERARSVLRRLTSDICHPIPAPPSHGRACPGHPRLAWRGVGGKTWMPATSAGMTLGERPQIVNHDGSIIVSPFKLALKTFRLGWDPS